MIERRRGEKKINLQSQVNRWTRYPLQDAIYKVYTCQCRWWRILHQFTGKLLSTSFITSTGSSKLPWQAPLCYIFRCFFFFFCSILHSRWCILYFASCRVHAGCTLEMVSVVIFLTAQKECCMCLACAASFTLNARLRVPHTKKSRTESCFSCSGRERKRDKVRERERVALCLALRSEMRVGMNRRIPGEMPVEQSHNKRTKTQKYQELTSRSSPGYPAPSRLTLRVATLVRWNSISSLNFFSFIAHVDNSNRDTMISHEYHWSIYLSHTCPLSSQTDRVHHLACHPRDRNIFSPDWARSDWFKCTRDHQVHWSISRNTRCFSTQSVFTDRLFFHLTWCPQHPLSSPNHLVRSSVTRCRCIDIASAIKSISTRLNAIQQSHETVIIVFFIACRFYNSSSII